MQSMSSWGGCQWVGDIFSTTRGGFYRVWQPLQIGHRQAAPLPLSTSLRRLGMSLLKGEQRREQLRDLIALVWRRNVLLVCCGAFWTGCSVTSRTRVCATGTPGKLAGSSKTSHSFHVSRADNQLLNILPSLMRGRNVLPQWRPAPRPLKARRARLLIRAQAQVHQHFVSLEWIWRRQWCLTRRRECSRQDHNIMWWTAVHLIYANTQ